MAFDPMNTAGNPGDAQDMGAPRVQGATKLFMKKNPGSPGKLGKSSTKAESLSKLRGKGALA